MVALLVAGLGFRRGLCRTLRKGGGFAPDFGLSASIFGEALFGF